MHPPLNRRRLLGALAAAAAPWPPARADASAPVDETWHDAARDRDLPVRIRWPAGAGPWPLVLYSHGLGGNRRGGVVWGEAWAAAGCAVVHLQHPGSDSAVLLGGRAALRAAASARQLAARAADVAFALDEVQRRQRDGAAGWAQVRADAVGVAGHSFGAQTAQAVAGRRFPGVGAALRDERPLAFIALSPSSGDGSLAVHEQFGDVRRPFLAVTGSLDGDPFGKFDSGAPRARVFDGLPPGARALLWLDGADHASFGGDRVHRAAALRLVPRAPGAAEHEARHQALVAQVTARWWRAWLAGDAAARDALRSVDGLAPGDRWQFG